MRTQNLRYRWLLGVVAVLVLGIACLAQQTEYSENKRLNMETHVNGMTGHATTGQPIYKRFCIGCHGELGRRSGRERAVDRSQAAQLHHRHLPLPLHADGNAADRHRSIRHRLAAACSTPTCRTGCR